MHKYIEKISKNYTKPIDYEGVQTRVNFFGKKLSSPIILGSGTLVEKNEDIEQFLNSGIGAVVPRTTRLDMVRKVHPSPHLHQTGGRKSEVMLNAEWTGADIEYWNPYLLELSKKEKIIFSVSGRDISDCVKVCEILDQYGFLMLEINVSCAHSNSIHGFITKNGEHIQKLVSSIKDAGIKTPIGIKLGYSDYIVELAQIAKSAGVDAIITLNTFGPLFDFTVRKNGIAQPVLGIEGSKGGMSGSSLFHIALTAIADIKHKVGIPVVACGGVNNPEQVVKMIMAGAEAVQIYTAAHVCGVLAPNYFAKLQKDLLKYMKEMEIVSLESVKGSALCLLDQKTNLTPEIPTLKSDECTGCDICIPVCLPKAIDIVSHQNKIGHIIKIDDKLCIGCGHCEAVCPFDAFNARI